MQTASAPDISLWRLAAAFIAVIPALMLNAHDVFMVTQIMGPSHALLAFLAQRRTGYYKPPARAYGFTFLIAIAISCGILFPLHFIFFVSAFFVLHNFLDDIVLFNTTPNWRTQALTVYAFAIFFLINVDSTYNLHILRDYLPWISLGLVGCILAMLGQTSTPQFKFLIYITANAFAMLALSYLAASIPPGRLPVENVFCFLVMTHYLNWYIYIYKKKASRGDRADTSRYVRHCLISNGFFVGLFILCSMLVNFDNALGTMAALVFVCVFHVIAFNVFTFMHLVTTVRPGDYCPRRA